MAQEVAPSAEGETDSDAAPSEQAPEQSSDDSSSDSEQIAQSPSTDEREPSTAPEASSDSEDEPDTSASQAAASEESAEKGAEWEALGLDQLLNVVVSASKKEQQAEQAPAVIDVVTCYEIRQRGYRTVGEALRDVPGIAIIDDLVSWNVGVRGLYAGAGSASDHIKVMINGNPVSFRPTSANFFGPELIPIDAVERVEIIRGPGSAMYGSNAFLGVINIITFDGKDDICGQKVHHLVGGEGFYQANEFHQSYNGSVSALSSALFGPFSFMVSGVFLRADRSGLAIPGMSDIVTDELNRIQPDTYAAPRRYPSPGWDWPQRERILRESPSKNDIERTGSLYGLASYSFGKAGSLSLDGSFQYFDKFGEFQDYSFLTHDNRIVLANGFGRLKYALVSDGPGLSLSASAAFSAGRPTSKEHLVDPLTSGRYMQRDFGYRAFDFGLEGMYEFEGGHTISLGADFTSDDENLETVEVINEQTGERNAQKGFGDKRFNNLGVYTQLVWKPLERLSLTGGARIDHNDEIACDATDWDCLFALKDREVGLDPNADQVLTQTDRGAFKLSTRAAAVYGLPFWGLYGKAMYGTSFKPPSPYQLYHEPLSSMGSRGYPDLRPQTADTYEFQLGANPTRFLRIYADVFLTTVDNFVLYLREAGALQSRNADARQLGMEGKVAVDFSNGLSLHGNLTGIFDQTLTPKKLSNETDFSWQNSVFNESFPAGMFPRFLANLGLDWLAPQRYLNVYFGAHYVGAREASVINNQLYDALDLKKTYKLDGYWLFELVVSTVDVEIFDGQETVFQVGIKNAPGNQVEPGYGGIDIPGRGPQVSARLQHRF